MKKKLKQKRLNEFLVCAYNSQDFAQTQENAQAGYLFQLKSC